jgi:hypothetical protein
MLVSKHPESRIGSLSSKRTSMNTSWSEDHGRSVNLRVCSAAALLKGARNLWQGVRSMMPVGKLLNVSVADHL